MCVGIRRLGKGYIGGETTTTSGHNGGYSWTIGGLYAERDYKVEPSERGGVGRGGPDAGHGVRGLVVHHHAEGEER